MGRKRKEKKKKKKEEGKKSYALCVCVFNNGRALTTWSVMWPGEGCPMNSPGTPIHATITVPGNGSPPTPAF